MTDRTDAEDRNAKPDLAEEPEWLEASGYPGSGRGIVICAGGLRMFTNAWVLVWMLRKVLNCGLAVEVWHLGGSEMSGGMRAMLEGLDVRVMDAAAVLERYPAKISDGWQLKAYAPLLSAFREVLMLDADNVPVKDPSYLFDLPEYHSTGAVFWPDMIDISASNPVWREVGLPEQGHISIDSGQLLVDKQRHRRALAAALHFNENADRFYRLIYGDKDTFLLAWLVTGSPFSLVPQRPIADRHAFHQRDFEGEIVFQHRTNAKWEYQGAPVSVAGFVHAAECEAALAELRRIWNGRFFAPPLRSPAAMRVEQLLEGRSYVAARPGERDAVLELLSRNEFGAGRDYRHENWYVTEEQKGQFVLHIVSRHRISHELERRDDDHWVEAGTAGHGLTLTAKSASSGGTKKEKRGNAYLRELCMAARHGSEWTPEAGAQLRNALELMTRLDPLLADDLTRFASEDGDLDDAARSEMKQIADDLSRRRADLTPGKDIRSDVNILFDRRFYVSPPDE